MADYLQFITGRKTTAHETPAEVEIVMPQYRDGSVPCVVEVQVEVPKPVADEDYAEWRLSTKSNSSTTALPNFDSSEVIDGGKRILNVGAAGEHIEDSIMRIVHYAPIPVTSAKLYFQCLQNLGTPDFAFRIGIVPRRIEGLVQRTAQQVAQF